MSKGHKPGLVRVKGQSKAPQPFPEYRQHPSRIVLALKADDEVVTLPDQGRFPPKPWLHLRLEPPIEHIVQGDVPQQW